MIDVEAVELTVGLPVWTAAGLLKIGGRQVRIGKINGHPQVITADVMPGRVTLEVEDGLVTALSVE